MAPDKVLAEAASTATFASFILGFQAVLQLAQLWGDGDLWTLGLSIGLLGSGVAMWKVGRALRAHKRWALQVMVGLVWSAVAASVCFTAWAVWPSPLPGNKELAELETDVRRFLPFFAVPWVALLCYNIHVLRRPEVRALMGEENAKAR